MAPTRPGAAARRMALSYGNIILFVCIRTVPSVLGRGRWLYAGSAGHRPPARRSPPTRCANCQRQSSAHTHLQHSHNNSRHLSSTQAVRWLRTHASTQTPQPATPSIPLVSDASTTSLGSPARCAWQAAHFLQHRSVCVDRQCSRTVDGASRVSATIPPPYPTTTAQSTHYPHQSTRPTTRQPSQVSGNTLDVAIEVTPFTCLVHADGTVASSCIEYIDLLGLPEQPKDYAKSFLGRSCFTSSEEELCDAPKRCTALWSTQAIKCYARSGYTFSCEKTAPIEGQTYIVRHGGKG